jgi:hypothetical protein
MTAAAHKLARIVYYMVAKQQEYDATVFQDRSDSHRIVRDRNCMLRPKNSGCHAI